MVANLFHTGEVMDVGRCELNGILLESYGEKLLSIREGVSNGTK